MAYYVSFDICTCASRHGSPILYLHIHIVIHYMCTTLVDRTIGSIQSSVMRGSKREDQFAMRDRDAYPYVVRIIRALEIECR